MQEAHLQQISSWTRAVSTHLDTLSAPQARVLALWSFAAVLLRTASLSRVSLFLAGLLDCKAATARQRLREFYKPADKKAGRQRRELDPAVTFTPLMRWVLKLWPHQQLALALDPTLCRDRFVCLAVSLVYKGGSVPLAWKILPANEPGAWMPHWQPLLQHLRRAVGPSYRVLVLTDRGLYQRELFEQIQALGFHPLMRIGRGGQVRLQQRSGHSPERWWRLPELLSEPGHCFQGSVEMFKTPSRRLSCTLIALWEPGYEEPWYLLTDLAPEEANGSLYGLRAWIEQGFRCVKSAGCQWEHSRITECARMERLWLVYALSLLLAHALAGEIEAGEADWLPASLSLTDVVGGPEAKQGRRVQRMQLGMLMLLVALLRGQVVPVPRGLHPDPWPQSLTCQPAQLGNHSPP